MRVFVIMLICLSSFALAEGMKEFRNLDYSGEGNSRQMIDLYVPEGDRAEPWPLVCWIHGGAWAKGSKKNAGQALILARLGKYAVASIGYRLTDEVQWPAQIHDCKAAIRFLRANAKTYQLDPDKVMVWGGSAGAHLATMLGVTDEKDGLEGKIGPHEKVSSKVIAVVNFFGPSDLVSMDKQGSSMNHNGPNSPEGKLIGGAISENFEKAKSASPLYFVSKGDAPILTVHGTKDRLVPYQQSVALDAAFEKVGVSSVMLTVEGAGHGRGFGSSVIKTVGDFLEQQLLGEKKVLKDFTVSANQ